MILSDQFVELADIPPWSQGSHPGGKQGFGGTQPLRSTANETVNTGPSDMVTVLRHIHSGANDKKYPQRATSLLLYQKSIAYLIAKGFAGLVGGVRQNLQV